MYQNEGGIAINTIPADCTLDFEFRSIDADDPAALIERFRAEAKRIESGMQQQSTDARVEFEVLAKTLGRDTPTDAGIVALAAGFGGAARPDKSTYGTEACLFFDAGIPTVVCCPGDIAQALAPDEFITPEQIAHCESFSDNLITTLLTKPTQHPFQTPDIPR